MPEINDKADRGGLLAAPPGIGMVESMLPDSAGGLRGGFSWWQR